MTTESDNTPVDANRSPTNAASESDEAPTEQAAQEGANSESEAAQDGPESAPAEVEAEIVAEPSELEQLRAERDKLKDQLLRTAADFDNFRKRTRRELEEAKMRGKDDAVRDLLPVFDNLERAVAAGETAQDVTSVVEGVRMVLKLFQDTAERMGLNRVESVGVRFDPNLHEAIQQEETDQHPPGTVVREVMPGYLFGKRLIRAAMVVVARAPAKPAASEGEAEAAPEGSPAESASKRAKASDAPSGGSGAPGSKAPQAEASEDASGTEDGDREAKPK